MITKKQALDTLLATFNDRFSEESLLPESKDYFEGGYDRWAEAMSALSKSPVSGSILDIGDGDGLAPYKYSIVMQNSSSPDYWTDMLADSFLSWTIPIYYGCTNLEAYFPKESFIRIDIEQPERSTEIIKQAVCDDNWEKRLPALEEARTNILYRYQFFPHMAKYIWRYATQSGIKSIQTIPAYHRTAKARLYRYSYKLKKIDAIQILNMKL